MLIIRFVLIIVVLSFTSCNDEPYWTQQQLNTLASFQLSHLDDSLTIKSNRYAKNKLAAKFGGRIFYDKRFSLDGSLSCASCHQQEKAFTDGLSRAKGIRKISRNTQTLLGAAYATWFYWDGRKDSLWSQALVPFEAEDEMAASRIIVLRKIGEDPTYRSQYEKLFGKFPEVIFDPGISEIANPLANSQTRDAWFRIPVSSQLVINKAYVNIGKSIAAYVRTIKLPETRFDKYVSEVLFGVDSQDVNALSEDERIGLKLFLDESKTHCLRCHNGPLFSDSEFHNIGTGNFKGKKLDFGRVYGIPAVVQDEFNCIGNYSDSDPEDCSALRFLPKQVHNDMYGAFKTPTLRYLNKTAPYFHDGRFESLNDVLNHYISVKEGTTELTPLQLTEKEKEQLIAFLKTLN